MIWLSGPNQPAHELFYADRYAETFGSKANLQLISGLSHMGITGEPAALSAVVAAARAVKTSAR